MAIKALWRIKAGNIIYEPGSIITGLNTLEEEELVALRAAEKVKEEVINEELKPEQEQGPKKKRK